MIVNSLNIVIERAELQSLVDQLTKEIDKLKELTVTLEKDRVVLAGRIAVGLTIPFTTGWQAQVLDQGRTVSLTLAGISVGMVGMGTEMISAQLLKHIASRLHGQSAVRLEGSAVVVDLKPALAARGIQLNAPLQKLEIAPAGITLEA
ncbi:MAG: hypothetical protein PHO37_01880 [Kiritimatiellae bacterium]|nr:hypothetical protein [Kiritimatiellia bacterium]